MGKVKAASTELHIRRPKNSFFFYRLYKLEILKQKSEYQGVNMQLLSKVIGNYWREEPEYVKEKFRQMAEKEKANHLKEFPEYRYRPKRSKKSPSVERDILRGVHSDNVGHYEKNQPIQPLPKDPLESYYYDDRNTHLLTHSLNQPDQTTNVVNHNLMATSELDQLVDANPMLFSGVSMPAPVYSQIPLDPMQPFLPSTQATSPSSYLDHDSVSSMDGSEYLYPVSGPLADNFLTSWSPSQIMGQQPVYSDWHQ